MCSGLVLINLAKAFDTVDYQILLHKLEHYGIRETVLQFYQPFFQKIESNLRALINFALLYAM